MASSASSRNSRAASYYSSPHRHLSSEAHLCYHHHHHTGYGYHRAPPASAFASSTVSAFSAGSHSMLHRSASPTRVNLVGGVPSHKPAVRFSIDTRPGSPHHALSVSPSSRKPSQPRRTCMCSPTTHPGSFRCAFHKAAAIHASAGSAGAFPSSSTRLNARRSAMTNSLVRIGSVEGDLVKRALSALIRPSSHQQRRRSSFQPRPSRLSVMSKAEEDFS